MQARRRSVPSSAGRDLPDGGLSVRSAVFGVYIGSIRLATDHHGLRAFGGRGAQRDVQRSLRGRPVRVVPPKPRISGVNSSATIHLVRSIKRRGNHQSPAPVEVSRRNP